MIVAGLLAAEPLGKDLAPGFRLEFAHGGQSPGPTMREPGEGAGANIKAQELGQQVIVCRGAVAAELREILQVAKDLIAEPRSDSSKQSPTPDQPASRRRAQAKLTRRSATSMPLDQADPGQKGIGTPPGAKRCAAASAAKASRRGQVIGRGEERPHAAAGSARAGICDCR